VSLVLKVILAIIALNILFILAAVIISTFNGLRRRFTERRH